MASFPSRKSILLHAYWKIYFLSSKIHASLWYMYNSSVFLSQLSFEPTYSQQVFFENMIHFFQNTDTKKCKILRGYAGTGKTTCLYAIVKALPLLGYQSVLLAPTGRAAKVMQNYTGKKAFTIHKKIYRKKSAIDPFSGFALAPNMASKTIFIIDEASMLTDEAVDFSRNSLLEDVIAYVYNQKDCYLMLVGDTAQLPPVGSTESRALDDKHLAAKFGLYLFDSELKEVIRQSAKSGILYNATQIRKQIVEQQSVYPSFALSTFKDIYKMTGQRLVEGLEYAYRKFGEENTLIVCRSNKSANMFNQQIRQRVLYREEELTGGDLVMVVKNNYFWLDTDEGFIANGDIAMIERVLKTEEKFGKRFANVRMTFLDDESKGSIDAKVLLDSITVESAQLPFAEINDLYEQLKIQYQEEAESKSQLMEKIKNDPYYNAIQIKFAYAVTCHKAQGGQWDAVFVDQGYLTDELLNVEFLRWMYTAVTRASKELFLVNFSPKFFPDQANDLENW